jgi:hypothetical protein
MKQNEFVNYAAAIGATITPNNQRLARAQSRILSVVAATIRRDVNGKVITTPSASLSLDNGEELLVPLTVIGRKTGANLSADDLYLLKGGVVHYFIANAEEGEEFAFRQNGKALEATTTGLFNTVHAIEPTEVRGMKIDELPQYHLDIDSTDGTLTPPVSDSPNNPESTLADKIAKATSVAELKPLLADEELEGIDEGVANMRSLEKMQDAMLAYVSGE